MKEAIEGVQFLLFRRASISIKCDGNGLVRQIKDKCNGVYLTTYYTFKGGNYIGSYDGVQERHEFTRVLRLKLGKALDWKYRAIINELDNGDIQVTFVKDSK